MTSMSKWIKRLTRRVAPFATDTRGATAMMFGIMAIPLILIAIGTIDIARHALMRQSLQDALDDATLIVARSTAKTDTDMDKVGDAAFLAALNNTEVAGLTTTFKGVADNGIDASATGSMSPIILGIIGISDMTSTVKTLVKRAQGTPVELVLVLDTTLSMKDIPGVITPLTDLKTAATKLVNDLHKNADGSNLKIGVVPFGQYVKVGLSRRNEPWIKVPAEYQTTTENKAYTQTGRQKCTGGTTYACTVVQDGRTVPSTCTKNQICTPLPDLYVPASTTIKDWKFKGCVGSPANPQNVQDSNPARIYPGPLDIDCNSEITPLTSTKATVLSAITALTAKDATYIPSGLAWGFNMLSKAQPLTDAAAYDSTGENRQPRKALVLMTDGANTMTMQATPPANGGYGFIHNKGATSGANLKQANDYTLELCANIKKEKIEVFTVAFMIDDANAKKLVEDCATDTAHYFDAADAVKLQAAFGAIADSLRNLYIAK